MILKGTLIVISLLLVTESAVSQFKNIELEKQTGRTVGVWEPVIAINPRYPNNIVAGFFPDRIYFTKDTGKTWEKSKVSFSMAGGPTIIADEKGNFFYFHVSGSNEESVADNAVPAKMVLHRSSDGGATWTEGEPIVSEDRRDPRKQWASVDSRGNLYVTWTAFDRYRDSSATCEAKVFFSMSKNGKKWTAPAVISQDAGSCMDGDDTPAGAIPAVTFDGKVIVAWSQGGKIFVDRSFNGGEWWLSNDILVSEQKGGWDLAIPGHDKSNGKPVLTIDNSKTSSRGSLYIAWADQRNGADDTDIWFTRSHNFGDNWSLPTRINNDARGKHQYLPWMTVDQSTGYIYIMYYDRRAYDDSQTDVYLAYSTDAGASFKNVRISDAPFTPTDGVFAGEYNNISAHRGIIAPVWTRVDEGKTSVWTAIIRHEDLTKIQSNPSTIRN